MRDSSCRMHWSGRQVFGCPTGKAMSAWGLRMAMGPISGGDDAAGGCVAGDGIGAEVALECAR